MKRKFSLFLQAFLQNASVQLTGAILLLCAVIYRQFLFGKDVFVWADLGSDTINSYWPAYTYFSNAIRHGFEFFSLKLALGVNIFSGSLLFFDPFMWLYALTDGFGIARLLIFVYIFKILIGALFFQRVLRYYIQSRFAIFIFSLLYAFSGFSVVWGQHYFFGTIVMVFPMILLGIERCIHKNDFVLLTFSMALGMISAYYFMFMAAFFLAVLVPARLFYLYNKDFRLIASKGLEIVRACILGIGVSALVLLPTIAATFAADRIKGQLASLPFFALVDLRTLWTIVGSFYSNNLLGSTKSFIGIGNYYDSPHFYSGLITLLIIPQIFFSQKRREKILVFALLGFSLISIFFPYASAIFNGFSVLYYRWTYYVVVFLILSAALAFQTVLNNGQVHRWSLIITLFGLASIATLISLNYYLYFRRHDPITAATGSFVLSTLLRILPIVFLLGVYFVLALKWFSWKYTQVSLAIFVMFELIWGTSATLLGRTPLSEEAIANKQNYFDSSQDVINNIKANDPGFYRIEKVFFSQFLNDGLMQGYRNIHAYWSIIPASSLNFFDAVGGGTAGSTQLGYIQSDVVRSLLSEKYYLTKSVADAPKDYDLIGKWGDVYALKNNHWVPMGAVYHSFISKSEVQKIPRRDRDNILAKACVIPDALVEKAKKLGLHEIVAGPEPVNELPDSAAFTDLKKLSSERLSITANRDDFIEGQINSSGAGIMFFPISADPGWEVSINNEKVEKVDTNWGLLGIFIEPGDQNITLKYVPPLFKEGSLVSGLSMVIVLLALVIKKRKSIG